MSLLGAVPFLLLCLPAPDAAAGRPTPKTPMKREAGSIPLVVYEYPLESVPCPKGWTYDEHVGEVGRWESALLEEADCYLNQPWFKEPSGRGWAHIAVMRHRHPATGAAKGKDLERWEEKVSLEELRADKACEAHATPLLVGGGCGKPLGVMQGIGTGYLFQTSPNDETPELKALYLLFEKDGRKYSFEFRCPSAEYERYEPFFEAFSVRFRAKHRREPTGPTP